MVVSVSGAASVSYYCGGGGGEELEQKPASYYLGAVSKGEPPGRWSGRLAAEIGLTGQVRGSVMEQVYTKAVAPDGTKLGSAPRRYKSVEERFAIALASEPGALPERVEAIRRDIEGSQHEACLGVDLTFSPPKSFTVAHTAAWRAEVEARRAGNEADAWAYEALRGRLEAALWTANQAALDCVAQEATSRAGTHGRGKQGYWVDAPDIVVASFHQHTNRANRGDDRKTIDPQQHIHNVVLNRAKNPDGQIRTLDTKDIAWKRPGYSAVADRVLAEELIRMGLGVKMRKDGVAWEIDIVPQEAMDLFSERRKTISAQAAPVIERMEQKLGRPVTELERHRVTSNIAHWSRVSKDSTESDWEQHLDQWQERLQMETGRGLVPIAGQLRAASEAATARAIESDLSKGLSPEFSPSQVLGVAREAVQRAATMAASDRKGTFTREHYMLEVAKALPLMPNLTPKETTQLVATLTDEGLNSLVQVAGRDTLPSLGADTPGRGFTAPYSVRYASPETIQGEQRIRDAAAARGAHALDRVAVAEWLDENVPSIGLDQRAMVEGVASSDAMLSVLVGKAGTGKSFAVGALDGVLRALSDGKVHGLTTAESAAEVLRGDGVHATANIDRWLIAQERMATGKAKPEDEQYRIGPHDILAVDEASMVATGKLDKVRQLAATAGAKVMPTGDPRQMGAIGAGGVMELLDGRAETYTLTEVRRFKENWEREASVGLWAGDLKALAEYDRRGRLVEYHNMSAALQQVARAAAADILDGKETLVVAGSNDEAAAVSSAIRKHLVEAGQVDVDGVQMGLDSNLAGVGDRVMTRQNDYELGVLNRQRWTVASPSEDGGLLLADQNGEEKVLPKEYVEKHLQAGYASTVHAAQGMTVDRAHYITDGRTGPDALYVGMTRGRERNTAHVSLSTPDSGLESQRPSGEIQVEEGQENPTAYSVLKKAFEREQEATSAIVAAETDEARERGSKHLFERRESVADLAVRERLERYLDELAAEGLLDFADRAELCADQGTPHLARILRAVEQTGADPKDVLREALAGRSLHDATSPAQVLSHRITSGRDLSTAAPGQSDPADIVATYAAQLAKIQERAADRARVLGSEMAQDAPAWATAALGPVPGGPVERLEWEAKAGQIAAYREATGWSSEKRPIPEAPAVTTTEHRGAWWGAWEALGRPESGREESGMSDARLQARVAAWEREKQWAPPAAEAALKESELTAETARQEAILARSIGDEEAAARHEAEAERRAAVARSADRISEGREAWYEETAETRAVAGRARAELKERGIEPGQEEDRVTAEEWLAAHIADREAEEASREVVAEAEVRDPVREEVRTMDRDLHVPGAPEVDAEAELPAPGPNNAHRVVDTDAAMDAESVEHLVAQAEDAKDRVADRESQAMAHDAYAEPVEMPAPTPEPAAVEVGNG